MIITRMTRDNAAAWRDEWWMVGLGRLRLTILNRIPIQSKTSKTLCNIEQKYLSMGLFSRLVSRVAYMIQITCNSRQAAGKKISRRFYYNIHLRFIPMLGALYICIQCYTPGDSPSHTWCTLYMYTMLHPWWLPSLLPLLRDFRPS